VTKTDPCRFCRIYAIAVVAFAALVGLGTTLQFMVTSGPGLQSHASQFVFHDSLRSLAPAAGGSALLLALVLWAQPLAVSEVQRERRRILWRAAAVALPGYLVAALTSIIVGLSILRGPFEQKSDVIGFALGIVTWRDFWTGGLTTLGDTLLIIFLAHRYGVRLQVGRLGLPEKLIVVVTVTVGLRATIALVLSSLVSF
jgi:hypothetical protein